MGQHRSEVRDGMRIEWDVPVAMDDGLVLRADVYRPPGDGEYPVIASYGPYGKLLRFQEMYPFQWERMVEHHPEVASGSTTGYLSWETVDPEKWVPDGYAVLRVDSRGAGRSPGHMEFSSDREVRDFAACIEWAARQPWSSGKVGLAGISYFAINQWQVAARRPDGLSAICVWEGAADRYRDGAHHGGIYCNYPAGWFEAQVKPVQHGVGENGFRSGMNGEWVAGPETLAEEELGANRSDVDEGRRTHKLSTEAYWEPRIPDLARIEVPVLSAGNWGGHGLHLRGNVEGFLGVGSTEKWLEIHGREHWTEFYTNYGVELQKRFFGHFLKGEDTGWTDQPPVQLQVRHPDGTLEERHESDWPVPRTEWTRYYLDAGAGSMAMAPSEPGRGGSVTYGALGDGVTFLAEPLHAETEVTGPVSARLYVESDTEDADLFLVVRLFAPDLAEVVFQGALDPHKPLALGWLRASHRKIDEDRSEPWRPYHPHDEEQPLEPGEIYELDVEVWPTSIVAPPGYRLGLSVRGCDYEYPGDVDPAASLDPDWNGVGPYRHTDPRDRPVDVYGGEVTLHTGPEHPSSLLLPIVPERE